MSRFIPSAENLRIEVDDASVEPYAIAAARALTRMGAQKVYFSSFVALQYPLLRRFKGAAITFLSAGQTPPNLVQSSRMLHSKGQLVLASPKVLREDQWRKIAADIEAEVARGSNAG